MALEYAIAQNNFSKTYRLDWKYKPGNLVLENPGLLLEIVRFWAEHGKAEESVKYYGELLARHFVPEHVRAAVLSEAIACAEKHHVPSAPVRSWREELLRLSPKQ